MQAIEGKMRSAIVKYSMIMPNDNIAVGLSGGKDSIVLLIALAHLRNYLDIPFNVTAITADPQFNGIKGDYTECEKLCDKLNVPYIIKRTHLAEIIFNQRKEGNPCSLCARMRRGILHNICKEQGCNRLALGHHFDDAVQTFFMNLFEGGHIGCFSPVTYLSKKQLWLIRPMIFVEERDIKGAVRRNNIPTVKSNCPVDGDTARSHYKELILQLEKQHPKLRKKVMGAMQRSHLDGF